MKNRVERIITLRVNGKEYELPIGTAQGQVPPAGDARAHAARPPAAHGHEGRLR